VESVLLRKVLCCLNYCRRCSTSPLQVREAEEFAEEDKKTKDKVDARNLLEARVYSLKNTVLENEEMSEKLSEEDKETVKTAVDDAVEWLDENQSAEAEEFESKLKELEKITGPIVSKVYQGAGGAGGAGAAGGDDDDFQEEL
jgi:endoplasmic reticulum chaperone BiP